MGRSTGCLWPGSQRPTRPTLARPLQTMAGEGHGCEGTKAQGQPPSSQPSSSSLFRPLSLVEGPCYYPPFTAGETEALTLLKVTQCIHQGLKVRCDY